jgi:hypothetical protein
MKAKYDAVKLAEMGYGDTGEAVVEMDDRDVRDLAQHIWDGRNCKAFEVVDIIAEIETARVS